MNLLVFFCLMLSSFSAQKAEIARLKPRADALLKLDVVEARPRVGVVFKLADDLADAGRLDEAAHYYEAGLRIEPHDFDHHLRYANLLFKLKRSDEADAQAQIIQRGCEDQALILKTQGMLGMPPIHITPIAPLPAGAPVLVLVPLGDVDLLLLQQEQVKLQDELKIDVEIRSIPFQMPEPDRIPRERTPENQQWMAEKLLEAFVTVVHPFGTANVRFLGITNVDIYAHDSNYMFGWREGNYGIISYRRFMASFNNEIPQRSRLLRRFHFQCLASAGHIFGLARCTDPSCPRAYPDSLEEQDAKSDKLCDVCQKGFESAFAGYKPVLPTVAIPNIPSKLPIAIIVGIAIATVTGLIVGRLLLSHVALTGSTKHEK